MVQRGIAFRVVLVLVFLVGCGSRASWVVLASSGPPSALRGAPSIAILTDAREVSVDGVPIGLVPSTERDEIDALIAEVVDGAHQELARRVRVPVVAVSDPNGVEPLRLTLVPHTVSRGTRGPWGESTEIVVELRWAVNGAVTDVVSVYATAGARSRMRGHHIAYQRTVWSFSQRAALLARTIGEAAAGFFESEQSR